MDPRAQALADLTAPGAAWEVRDEIVVGEKLPVFADRHHSLTALLAACAAEFADRDCLVAGDWRVTFGALPALITSLAEQLANRYGIGHGDRVAIWAGNGPEWALVFWAAVSRGAIVAACNDRWTADEAAHALADCEPSLLVIDERCRSRFDPSPDSPDSPDSPFAVLALGDVRALAETQPAASLADITAAVDEDDPALILYTSGTTGRAKGALISHRALVGFVHVQLSNVAIGMELALRFGVELPPAEPIRVLMTSPMFHVSGLMAGILLCLGNGDTMIIHQGRFDPAEVLRTIGRERVTNWAPLGSMGPRVLDALAADPASYNVESVRQLGFGGAPLSPTLRQRLLDAFPNAKRAGMGYGSSETVAVVTSIGGPEFDAHPTSAGRLMPTMALEIRDERGVPQPDGVEGEIHVRSAYTMLGYWRNEVATTAAIKPGRWLATGDIGTWRDAMLWINSRARDMILRSGENIYPIEIEHRLAEHPAVAEVAVVGVDHDVLGQEVKAVIVPVAGASVEPAELAAFAASTLSSYKVPSQWEIRRDALPRNAAGKVLKSELT